MSIFKPSTWQIVKVYKDISAFRNYIKIIKSEFSNKKSNINKWNIKRNMFYTLYFTMDIDEVEEQLPENIKRVRLLETLAPLHRYLDEELGLAGYLAPEFNQFYNSEGKPTLTYLIMYRYTFDTISFKLFLKWAFYIIITIVGLHFLGGYISSYLISIIEWIKNFL